MSQYFSYRPPKHIQFYITEDNFVTQLAKGYFAQRAFYEKKRAILYAQLEDIVLTQDGIKSVGQRTKRYTQFLSGIYDHSKKYSLTSENNAMISTWLSRTGKYSNRIHLNYPLPKSPLWIELSEAIHTPSGTIAGLLFYHPNYEYKKWARSFYQKDRVVTSRILNEKEWWILEGIDEYGTPRLILRYHDHLHIWKFSFPHVCPFGKCIYFDPLEQGPATLYPCQTCTETFEYLQSWFYAIYEGICYTFQPQPIQKENNSSKQIDQKNKDTNKHQKKKDSARPKDLKKQIPSVSSQNKESDQTDQNIYKSLEIKQNAPTIQQTIPSIPTPPFEITPSPTKAKKPTVVTNPLLIDRYIKKQHKVNGETIEKSHKYLWMHSAWMMAEALRYNTDEASLRIPNTSIYIELEQPRTLHMLQIAAFSFLQENDYWSFSAIDNDGQAIWSTFYEDDIWTLPYNYHCPEQKCTLEDLNGVRTHVLCDMCQQRITHFTSWLAVALRMIAGDFQEYVEMQEPDVTLEPSTKTEQDENTGQKKEVSTLRHYRIIRYYDACIHKSNTPQTKRGSWMSKKPLAESEYEINPNAIIYVQIQPKDHDRTYRHERYTQARGKTRHIEPRPRLQPMTIATFRQLPHIQRITKVTASKFEQEYT